MIRSYHTVRLFLVLLYNYDRIILIVEDLLHLLFLFQMFLRIKEQQDLSLLIQVGYSCDVDTDEGLRDNNLEVDSIRLLVFFFRIF